MNKLICGLDPAKDMPEWLPGVDWSKELAEEIHQQRHDSEVVFGGMVKELFSDIAPKLEAEVFPADRASRRVREAELKTVQERVIAGNSRLVKLGLRALSGALQFRDTVSPTHKRKNLERRLHYVWYSPVIILAKTMVANAIEATQATNTGKLALTADELSAYAIANRDEDYLTRVAGFNSMDVDFALKTAASGLVSMQCLQEPTFLHYRGTAVTLRTQEA